MKPNMFILYVNAPQTSAKFYSELLDVQPAESSETFLLYRFSENCQLGLWKREGVEPVTDFTAEGIELAILIESKAKLLSFYQDLQDKNIEIIQAPIDMSFGHTFTILSPDKNRIRFYTLPSKD
jgi:catechol-2,3-dioxygenase